MIRTAASELLTVRHIGKTGGRIPERSLLGFSDGTVSAKAIILPGAAALVGKVELTAAAEACAAGDSLPVAVQIIEQGDASAAYITVADGFLRSGGRVTWRFPGRHARAMRIVYETPTSSQEPIADVRVYEIHLSAASRIMLLGDSITDGKYADDGVGYRKELYHLLQQKGLAIDFVGAYGDPPYESHFQGGRKIKDFFPISQGGSGKFDVTWSMDNYRPNVIAVHLGTNDLGDGFEGPVGPYHTDGEFNNTPSGNMAKLVKYLLGWHDGTRGSELQHIFVSLIIPIKYQDSLMILSSIEVARMVRDYQLGVITGRPEPVHIVDHFTRFFEDPTLLPYYQYHMADRLHPNTNGHHIMALTYAEVIATVLSGQLKWFSDRTWETATAGIDNQFGEQGVAVADANQDGLEDIYVSRTSKNTIVLRDLYYQNRADGVFQERAEAMNIQDSGDSRGVLFADADNDGDLDLFNGNSSGRNRLYDNVQNQSFQDITTGSGLANINAVTTALLVFDSDNDGDMDFYAVNSRTVNELYLNDGAGRYTRVDRGADDVEEPEIASVSAVAADYDGDGDVDIYIVKRSAANKLFKNDGNGYFTESAQAAGLAFTHKSNSAVWADLDNDGDLDLIVSVSNTSSDPNPILRFFKNAGNGTFQDISGSINIPMDGYSPLVGDFDNDGHIDIITTLERGVGGFYRNNGNWSFSKVNNTGAEIFAGDVRGGAVFDYDEDGDLDFYVVRNDVFNVLKRNNLNNGNHYIRVEARGANAGHIGFGARLWLYAAGQLGHAAGLLGYREVMSTTGHISQYSPIQHFGLGSRSSYDLLAHFSDGTLCAYRNGAVDQKIIIEPQKPSSPGGMPAELIASSGQDQIDTVAQQLPQPLIARVLDAEGKPVAGVRVDFSVIQGEATLITPAAAAGDAIWLEAELGRLSGSMRWAYDPTCSNSGFVLLAPSQQTAGYDTLTAELTRAANYAIWLRVFNPGAGGTLFYTVDAGSKQSLAITTSNNWQWIRLTSDAGAAFPAGSRKIVLESSLRSLQIDKLLLTADMQYLPDGLGEENHSDPLTSDREGMVRRFLQLGTQAGHIVVQARMEVGGQFYTVFFPVTARPGLAVAMVQTSGNHQTGLPDVPLSQPFVVTLYDAYDNPTPDVAALYTVESGGGTLSPADGRVVTDTFGQAKATLTPGRSSSLQRVTAAAGQVVGSPALFEATVPGIAARIACLDGNLQADTVYAVLGKPVQFRITAENGDPVPGYLTTVRALDGGRVSVTPAVGSDSVLQVYSDQTGTAQVYWRLGPRAGTQTLRLEASGLDGSPLLIHADAAATEPYRLYAAGGDGQMDTVATRLAKPFVVRVTDRYGNPRSGLAVFFRVIRGNGTFDGAQQYSALTGAFGDVGATFTLGTQAGNNIYEIHASCSYNGTPLLGSPVSFWAGAWAGPPRFIFAVSGDGQSGTAGALLSHPLVVAVKDFYQNAVIGGAVRFTVMKGNGLLNGASEKWMPTDSSGLASGSFQLGSQAGVNMHEVVAEIETSGYERVRFVASAVPDKPARLVYFSGDGQAAVVQTQLTEPLCVAVWDQYENPIAGHRVLFEVISPTGSFAGGRELDEDTDLEGRACAFLLLGNTVGDSVYIVRAVAKDENPLQDLTGSPLLFYASGLHTYPARLWPLTSPSQTLIGTAGRELSEPVRVRVVDDAGQGVPGIAVFFDILSGEGRFIPDSTEHIAVLSGADGAASARWLLGNGGGIQQLQASASYEGYPLSNSPIRYSAVAVQSQAQAIHIVAGENQTGTVGEALSQSISFQVTDDLGHAVANHPVQIQVKDGGGGLDAVPEALLLKYSDNDGLIRVQWRLGPTAGDSAQALEVVSKDGQGDHLHGSPLYVYAKALPASPSVSQSGMTAESPVAADGSAGSTISAIVRDRYGNVIPGLPVRLALSGMTATVAPLQGSTDAQGRFQAVARSDQAGDLTVRLQDVATATDLTVPVTVRFLSLQATLLRAVSGDGQTAQVAQPLPEAIMVQVLDVFDHPVPDAEVRFVFQQGDGEMAFLDGTPQWTPMERIVKSDADGFAGVRIRLGIFSGTVTVQAYLLSMPAAQTLFRFHALPAEADLLAYLTGDGQTGSAGHRLGQPLSVQLVDVYANPIAGEIIMFDTQNGGYFAPAASAISDSAGIARVFWYLGLQVGEQKARAAYGALQYVFSAAAGENQAPMLSLPDSVILYENRSWSMTVSAFDAENDSISIHAQNLPDGAQFTSDWRFAWTPDYDQSGRYEVLLIATDHLGAVRTKNLIIIVVNVNRPPRIDIAGSQPPTGSTLILKKPASLDFRAVAYDDDGDSLGYVWFVNNVLRAVGSPQYRFNSEPSAAGDVTVKVIISDRKDTTSLTWRLQIVTSVTLAEFSAHGEPYKGIVLRWRTAGEKDNVGFQILRADHEDGSFRAVSPFIAREPTGIYQFVDADIAAGTPYFYRLQSIGGDGARQQHPVVQAVQPLPMTMAIISSYPNPFNASTVILFSLPRPMSLQVEIYDLMGRRVRQLCHERAQAGYHRFRWDGKDESGVAVAGGVYHWRVRGDDVQLSRKVVLIR